MDDPLLSSGWEITGIQDADRFFASLERLLPSSSVLVFEGTAMAPGILELLRSHNTSPEMEVPKGTLFPKASVFHVPFESPVVAHLVELAKACAEPEICDHFHAYAGPDMLLQWYDWFDGPLQASRLLSEPGLRRVCELLGAQLSVWQAG